MKYKKKSKRVPLKRKANIKKKISEHHRKIRKAARKAQHPNAKHKHKSMTIPNNFPEKEEMLAEAIAEKQEREMKAEEEQRKKAEQKKERRQMREAIAEERGLSLAEAEKELKQMEKEEREMQEAVEEEEEKEKQKEQKPTNYKPAWEDFRSIVNESDIVILTVNATDPLVCRNRSLEKYITEERGKHLFIVLTKVDLVPREVVKRWLDAFRHEYPTFLFKSNFSSVPKKRSRQYWSPKKEIQDYHALGLKQLLWALDDVGNKMVTETKDKIISGIIGYPQTGKKTLLTTLRVEVHSKMDRDAVSRRARFHNSPVWFIDVPGRICIAPPPTLYSAYFASSIKKGMRPLKYIYSRVPSKRLQQVFCVPPFSRLEQFIHNYAVSHNMFKKKGRTPDEQKAILSILNSIYECDKNLFALPSGFKPETDRRSEWEQTFPRWNNIIEQDETELTALFKLDDIAVDCLPMTMGVFGRSPFVTGPEATEEQKRLDAERMAQLPKEDEDIYGGTKNKDKKKFKVRGVKFADQDNQQDEDEEVEEEEDDDEMMENDEDFMDERDEHDEAELDRIQSRIVASGDTEEDDYDFNEWNNGKPNSNVVSSDDNDMENDDDDDDDDDDESMGTNESDEDEEEDDPEARAIMDEYYAALEAEDDENSDDDNEEDENSTPQKTQNNLNNAKKQERQKQQQKQNSVRKRTRVRKSTRRGK